MNNQLAEKAKEIIEKIIYITLATSSKNAEPWNSPVFAAYDKKYNFYWRSDKNATHSQNIISNNKVFITIYDSTIPWGKGKGVYIQATASELADKEKVHQALSLLDERSGTSFGRADQFLHDSPRRVYKAIPEKIWINVDGEINGKFIDLREELILP